jgi:uncharacterized protein (TIGR02117 family)
MKILKRILLWLRWLLVLPLLVLVYLGLAWVGSSISVNTGYESQLPKDKVVYLVSNGVHIDLVLPAEDLPTAWRDHLPDHMKNCMYHGFGWGDRGFYLNTPTWESLSLGTTARALLLPSPTVMHVSCYSKPDTTWKEVAMIRLDRHQLDLLLKKIGTGFEKDTKDCWQRIEGESYGSTDMFYEGSGSYHAFFTCNNWAGHCLRKSDIPTVLWSPFPDGLIGHASKGTE